MSKAWQAYAQHILDAIEKIRRIQQRGDLTRDEVLYDATLRNLQTLSEATQRLPDELKRPYPAIPWQQISSFRNILVHNYLGDRPYKPSCNSIFHRWKLPSAACSPAERARD